jgi:hypothetical protein
LAARFHSRLRTCVPSGANLKSYPFNSSGRQKSSVRPLSSWWQVTVVTIRLTPIESYLSCRDKAASGRLDRRLHVARPPLITTLPCPSTLLAVLGQPSSPVRLLLSLCLPESDHIATAPDSFTDSWRQPFAPVSPRVSRRTRPENAGIVKIVHSQASRAHFTHINRCSI